MLIFFAIFFAAITDVSDLRRLFSSSSLSRYTLLFFAIDAFLYLFEAFISLHTIIFAASLLSYADIFAFR